MTFLEKLLDLIGYSKPEELPAEEVGTTQPPLYSEEQRRLSEEFGDTEMLADIFNAQRTMENPQVELGARYMDKYRSEVPEGLAALMFQPHTNALGSAAEAGSMYNTLGTGHHQIKLKSLKDLEEFGMPPEKRDETIFHELGHIGEFITKDLIRAGVIHPSLASDYQMMGAIGGLGDFDLAHTAIETMDEYYPEDQMRGRIPRGENLGSTEFNKGEISKRLRSKTYDEIQAEINAEQKRIGKGKWNSRLDELVAQRDEAKASPTQSIEVTDEEAKNIVLAEQARVDNQNKSPTEQILDAIFSKELEDRMVSGYGRYYLDTPVYKKGDNSDITQEEVDAINADHKRIDEFRSKKYGFDVTDFSPENVAKMVDNMKRHTRSANELAEMIIEDYPWGYIKEKVTDGY